MFVFYEFCVSIKYSCVIIVLEFRLIFWLVDWLFGWLVDGLFLIFDCIYFFRNEEKYKFRKVGIDLV